MKIHESPLQNCDIIIQQKQPQQQQQLKIINVKCEISITNNTKRYNNNNKQMQKYVK